MTDPGLTIHYHVGVAAQRNVSLHRWPEDARRSPICVVRITYDLVGGRVEPVETTVTMANGKRQTVELIRQLPLGTWYSEDRATHHNLALRALDTDRKMNAKQREQVQQFAHQTERSGVTHEKLVAVAEVYREAAVVGDAPTKAVAEHFDAPYDTAKKWVRRARDAGLLGPPRTTRKDARR